MSSPNHPTSDIEDAFSSNFPDYISASPDYVPALPGKTYSSSSNNSFGLVIIASPTLMTQAAIKRLVADSVSAALEAQTATMANADNTNRNNGEREAHVARKCSYKEFMSCQPINFKGTEGAFGLIRWFERTESVFSQEAYKITWVKFKKLLIKKYCPRTEVQKMEDEFYHLTVKGNDLKAYVRRFQELATLCPTMVPDSKKMMEVSLVDCL
ncbi:reverse transcriptase domain-containing protein [Tanacetum coccineum]